MKNYIKRIKHFSSDKINKLKSFYAKTKQNVASKLNPFFTTIKEFFTKVINFLHLDKIIKFLRLDRIFNKFIQIHGELFKKLFLLIIVPILIYLYCQLFCNGKLIFETERMKLNFILIYFIIAFFYCVTGKVKVSLYLTTFLTGVIGIINHFITAFRGTPLVPWDIFSLNVALTVLPTFKFTISKNAIIGIIIVFLTFLILKLINIRSFRNNKYKVLYRIIVLAVTISFTLSFYLTDSIKTFELDENWDPKEEYHNNGLIASLFKQSKNLIIKKADGYDINSISELADNIQVSIVNHDDDENYKSPNVIAIMNESFADLSVIGNFRTNVDYMPFFKSLKENTIKGNLHMSVFGATTPNSEWEFLTSNSMAFVPKRTVPYQQYVLRKSYSLATILKEQGYSTQAIHSYYPHGYNRNLAYPRLGFDKFYGIYDLKDLNYIREYPDDRSTYQNIIDLYENKKEGEKFFNFTLTMQNHGSYTDENFVNTVIAEDGQYPKLNQYLSLIKEADSAFQFLIDYFSKQEEPTIIVMFGDHQPYVEDEFYDSLLSQNFSDIYSKEASEKKYITPFIIWANYDIPEENYDYITDISANYLASLTLDVAGIQKTPYLTFLDEIRNELPIITGNGYMDKNGKYHDFSEENEYTELIKEYNYLQFNNMFDNSSKLTSLFEVPAETKPLK